MGWSCRADAGDVMQSWTRKCVAATGSQNTYTGTDGRGYFWEVSRREHDDGAITGTVYQHTGPEHCRKAGSFRIDGDGTVSRYPTAWPFTKPEKIAREARRRGA